MSSVLIIGGGASGMAAAITAAERGASVTLLEANDVPGRKILATGNGRCNFTNMRLDASCYHGNDPDFISAVISNAGTEDVLCFAESCGIFPHMRQGYVYPRTDRADSARDALVRRMGSLGVKTVTGCHADSVAAAAGGFRVSAGKVTYDCERLILAAGSRASAIPGSDGSGYGLAVMLGHSIGKIFPALTGLTTDQRLIKRAAGVRTQCIITLLIDGRPDASEEGELQITDKGISGIPVMQLSGAAAAALDDGRKVEVSLDLLPELSVQEALELTAAIGDLSGLLPAGILQLDHPADIASAVRMYKSFVLPVTGTRGFEQAQVCRGGVDTSEIDPATCGSRVAPGAYITGELLDADGICGGYNLHFAFATGILAGCAAAGEAYRGAVPTSEQHSRWERSEIGSRRR